MVICIFVPPFDKKNKVAFAHREDSGQPGHQPSLIRDSAVHFRLAKGLSYIHRYSEASAQTEQIPRMIRVFAWRTCRFIGFVVCRLNYLLAKDDANFANNER